MKSSTPDASVGIVLGSIFMAIGAVFIILAWWVDSDNNSFVVVKWVGLIAFVVGAVLFAAGIYDRNHESLAPPAYL